jgi:nitrogen fixation NifU-like protein
MESATHKVHYKNPTCGDIMTMYARIKNDTIENLSFIGEGCFISMASSSMFTTIANGKTIDEVNELSNMMNDLIKKGIKVEDERLEEAISLENVHELPARYNCALMPWQAFQKLIKSNNNGR